jgi:hypothetical protein
LKKLFCIFSPLPLALFTVALVLNSGAAADIFGYSGCTLSFFGGTWGIWLINREKKTGNKKQMILFFATLLVFTPQLLIVLFGIYEMFHPRF